MPKMSNEWSHFWSVCNGQKQKIVFCIDFVFSSAGVMIETTTTEQTERVFNSN